MATPIKSVIAEEPAATVPEERLTDERLLQALVATYDLVLDRQSHLLLAQSDLRRYTRMYYERKARGSSAEPAKTAA